MKRLQKQDGGTLDELVSELLSEGLRARRADPAEHDLDWTSQAMHARVDLEDKEVTFAVLDQNRQ